MRCLSLLSWPAMVMGEGLDILEKIFCVRYFGEDIFGGRMEKFVEFGGRKRK